MRGKKGPLFRCGEKEGGLCCRRGSRAQVLLRAVNNAAPAPGLLSGAGGLSSPQRQSFFLEIESFQMLAQSTITLYITEALPQRHDSSRYASRSGFHGWEMLWMLLGDNAITS